MKSRLLFFLFVALLLFARGVNGHEKASEHVTFSPSLFSSSALKVIAGHLPGLVADFKILEVISIFGEMQQKKNSMDYGLYIYEDLKQSTDLDPMFYDPYRLASSILAFDVHMPSQAVQLLEKGTYALPHLWDIPFLGAFLAYEQLGESRRAFKLMSLSAARKGAPPVTPLIASRFLNQSSGKDDAIIFLESMLKIVPESYQSGITQRIKELRDSDE